MDEDVETAEAPEHFRREACGGVGDRQVGREGLSVATGLPDQLERSPGGIGSCPGMDRDAVARASQADGQLLPQPPPGSGHEGRFHTA